MWTVAALGCAVGRSVCVSRTWESISSPWPQPLFYGSLVLGIDAFIEITSKSIYFVIYTTGFLNSPFSTDIDWVGKQRSIRWKRFCLSAYHEPGGAYKSFFWCECPRGGVTTFGRRESISVCLGVGITHFFCVCAQFVCVWVVTQGSRLWVSSKNIPSARTNSLPHPLSCARVHCLNSFYDLKWLFSVWEKIKPPTCFFVIAGLGFQYCEGFPPKPAFQDEGLALIENLQNSTSLTALTLLASHNRISAKGVPPFLSGHVTVPTSELYQYRNGWVRRIIVQYFAD